MSLKNMPTEIICLLELFMFISYHLRCRCQWSNEFGCLLKKLQMCACCCHALTQIQQRARCLLKKKRLLKAPNVCVLLPRSDSDPTTRMLPSEEAPNVCVSAATLWLRSNNAHAAFWRSSKCVRAAATLWLRSNNVHMHWWDARCLLKKLQMCACCCHALTQIPDLLSSVTCASMIIEFDSKKL